MNSVSPITKDLFDAFMKFDHHKKSLIEIKDLKFSQLPKGENYICEAYRIEAKYLRCDGTLVTEYFFLKVAPISPSKRKYINELGLLNKEIKVYAELLPQMEQLLHSFGDYTEMLWPECIGSKCYDLILMKDLISRGYTKCDKRLGLDLEHSVLVLKAIAKFHALSVILDDRMLLDHHNYQEFGFTNDNETLTNSIKLRLEIVVDLMKGWGVDWQSLRLSIEENIEQIHPMIIKSCKFNPNTFNVVNHGDLWTSNILFKRCNFTGNLCGVKFLDYQESHYNSYAIDIQYFLYSSVQGKVRKSYYNELINAYYESLINSFKLFDYQPKNLPTLDSVFVEVEKRNVFGIFINIYLLHMMQATPEEAVDIEDWLHGDQSESITNSEHFATKAKEILEPFKNVDLKCFL